MKHRTVYILIALSVIIPLGFLTKLYNGPAGNWVNNSLGGVFYEIFWCLILYLVFTKMKPITIAITVFTITCLLELSQMWKPEFLEILRENFIVRTIIGNSFAWTDFIYYVIGSLAGYGMIIAIRRLSWR